jgi:hypothetical protein
MQIKKIIAPLVILLLCVIFPFVSWYYIKQGFNYRKQVLDELADKIELDTSSIDSIDNWLIKDKVVIINLHGDTSTVAKLDNQFKSVKDFVMLSTSEFGAPILSHKSHQYFEQVAEGKKYLLIDNGGLIRYKYNEDPEELKLMVKHIATLIPFVEKRKKLK